MIILLDQPVRTSEGFYRVYRQDETITIRWEVSPLYSGMQWTAADLARLA